MMDSSSEALARMDATLRNFDEHTLPTPAELRDVNLSAQQQSVVADRMATCGLRVAKVIEEALANAQRACRDDSSTSLDAPRVTILDIVSADRRVGELYAETALWEHVSNATQILVENGKKQLKGTKRKACTAAISHAQSQDPAGKAHTNGSCKQGSFRDFYVEQVTHAFGDDLQDLRSDPSFKGRQQDIASLVDCIESGADVFEEWETDLQLNSFAAGQLCN